MDKHSLLLIDDDCELSDLLSDYFFLEGFDIDCAEDGEAGLRKALSGKHYDVILLDVMMPKMNGFDVLKQLRLSLVTPLILLTAKDEEFERIYGLELGADDYLAKPFNSRELLARIKALLRRIQYVSNGKFQPLLSVGQFEINNTTGEARYAGEIIDLTGTEFSILQLLAANRGQMTHKCDISESVFGRQLAPFDRSIDMHVSNLRKKIGQHTSRETIRTIRGGGYMMVNLWAG